LIFLESRFVDLTVQVRQHFSFIISVGFVFFLTQQTFGEKNTGDLSGLDQNTSMSYGDALVYGLVEGVTEFLPISSTGHLVLAKEVLAPGAVDEREEALNAYLIVIQAGAIFAVTLIYRKQVWSILLGFFGLDPRGRRLGTNLLIAFLPAAMLGPFLDDLIESYLLYPRPIACALFTGAILMYWVERKRKKENSFGMSDSGKSLDDLTARSSLLVGFLQCFAMWPGTSRSMMTIVGGYLVGLKRAKAAEFSFLLGLITLTAAAAYKSMTKWEVMQANLEIGPVLFGCLIAGASAATSVVWLVGYLARRGLGIFVWYRILLAAIILSFYFWQS
jgi:undecaprenyl-diphosphatase